MPAPYSSHPYPSEVTAPNGAVVEALDEETPDAEEDRSPRRSEGRHARSQDRAAWLDSLEFDDLRRLMTTMPVIEQAKGVLMGYYAISDTEAFAVMRRWSSVHNVKIAVLSAELVEAACRRHAKRYGGVRDLLVSRGLS